MSSERRLWNGWRERGWLPDQAGAGERPALAAPPALLSPRHSHEDCCAARTCAKEKSRVMLQSMPCFCSFSHARMPSQVEAICARQQTSHLEGHYAWHGLLGGRPAQTGARPAP